MIQVPSGASECSKRLTLVFWVLEGGDPVSCKERSAGTEHKAYLEGGKGVGSYPSLCRRAFNFSVAALTPVAIRIIWIVESEVFVKRKGTPRIPLSCLIYQLQPDGRHRNCNGHRQPSWFSQLI